MPEGHSLELAARRLRPIVGARVEEGPLAGAVVSAVEARGKHLLVHAADGRCLHAHLGLHGRVRLRPPGEGRGRHVVRTGAGDVVIAGRVEVAARPPRLGLGPDLLHGSFDAAAYLRRARAVDWAVGEVLVDQRVVAGVGNIVKSEALWACRQSPFTPVSALSDRRLLELAATARRILRAGLAGRLPANVYRRAGRPCPRCGSPVASAVQGELARRTYHCPRCQRDSG
ncbi:MAG TPA: DNA-formamidopyrimidine glycosylase family protein [Gaiellales bacterium]|nr:DNA-formamidopyrimidine glycosylase family protein [Gaiellales bacterium]